MHIDQRGRKSDRQCGWDIFGTGVITAVNHDAGTAPVRKEQLKISATSATNSYEQFRKTQAGILSIPGDVFLDDEELIQLLARFLCSTVAVLFISGLVSYSNKLVNMLFVCVCTGMLTRVAQIVTAAHRDL